MHESLLLVSQHFSNYSPLIQDLFQSSDMFREICMDYHKCNNAFHFWSNQSSQEALLRKQEYSVLLQDLEKEILQKLTILDS